jgi:hypothetical protein
MGGSVVVLLLIVHVLLQNLDAWFLLLTLLPHEFSQHADSVVFVQFEIKTVLLAQSNL